MVLAARHYGAGRRGLSGQGMPGSTTRSADTSATSTSPWRSTQVGQGIQGPSSRQRAGARGVPVKDPPKTLSQSSSTCCSASTAEERRSVSTRNAVRGQFRSVAPRTPTRRSAVVSSSMRCARLSLASSARPGRVRDRGERAWLLNQIWSLACRFSSARRGGFGPRRLGRLRGRHRTAVLGAGS